ncbi:MAG: MFS transporter [Solirubrobacteraceae bacterium]
MTGVLRIPAYRRLLLAYGLTEIAWTVVSLALAVMVYNRTGSALGAAGFFICAQFVPAFFAPPLVARVDRRAPRQALLVLYALEAGLFALLAWLVGRIGVGWVLALALIDGIIALVVRSLARAATVAVTAPPGLLREGNALTNTVFSICLVAGPAIGGVIVAVGSTRTALVAGAAMVMLIAVALATAHGLPDAVGEDSPSKGRLKAALRYVRGQPAIRTLLALQIIGLVFFTMSIPVELVLAQHTLHAGASGYAALLTTWGGGAVAGSLIFARWRHRSSWLLIASGAGGLGVGFLIMATAPTLAVAAVGAVVAGAGNGIHAVAARTALQEHVKPQWMALVMSLNESIGQALPGVGILLGGAVAQIDGARTAFLLAGAGSLVVAAAVCLVLRHSLDAAPGAEPLPVGPLTFAAQRDRANAHRDAADAQLDRADQSVMAP